MNFKQAASALPQRVVRNKGTFDDLPEAVFESHFGISRGRLGGATISWPVAIRI